MIKAVTLDNGKGVMLGFDNEKEICIGVGQCGVDMTCYEIISEIYEYMKGRGLMSILYIYGDNLQEHLISRYTDSPFYLDNHGFICYK